MINVIVSLIIPKINARILSLLLGFGGWVWGAVGTALGSQKPWLSSL